MIAVLTGSVGLALPGEPMVKEVTTPYGDPSAPLEFWNLGDGAQVITLARHGANHAFAPHEINYRANIRALKDAGATGVVALCTVGGVDPAVPVGSLVVTDQLIDYTWGRVSSFGGHDNDAPVAHAIFSEPFDADLRARLLGVGGLVDGGTYACTQGPRLETAAEVQRLARDGCTLVGMTAMPEAVLARELELPYAALCLVVNPAAGVGDIDAEDMRRIAVEGRQRLTDVVAALA